MIVVFEENRVEDHCIKMSGLVEKRATSATCMLNGIGQTYVTEFKLTGINYIVKTNNYNAARIQCCRSKCTKMECKNTEADKCKLHPKIFQWP